jgi:hypothetical protein
MWQDISFALQQSIGRVLSSLASLLPAVLAMLVAVLIAAIMGGGLRWLLVRMLRGLRFDQHLDGWGLSAIAEWSPDNSPTRLAGRVVFWVFLLGGVLVGLAALDPTLMATVFGRLITYLPNVFVAILLLLLGAVLAKFFSRGALIGAVNLGLQSAGLIAAGVKWLILILAGAMALEHLSIGGDVLKLAFGILFGGIVLAMALAVGLGSKDMVQRSWERRTGKKDEPVETPFRHL